MPVPTVFQVILALIAIFFLSVGTARFLKQERSYTLFKFIVTLVIWGGIFTFSVVPSASHLLSRTLGLGDNLNTLIFIGFVGIFIILFKLLSIIERLERNISEIVRKEALEKLIEKKE